MAKLKHLKKSLVKIPAALNCFKPVDSGKHGMDEDLEMEIGAVKETNDCDRDKNPPGDFFSLPAEIRNYIYRLALQRSKPYKPCDAGYVTPALLHVCRRMREEARGIYYGEGGFRMCSQCARTGLGQHIWGEIEKYEEWDTEMESLFD